MREISTEQITLAVKKMCIDANLYLAQDMKNALLQAGEKEENVLGKKILGQLKENLEIGIKIDLRENADYIKKFYETMTAIKSSHADLNRLKVRIA